MNTSAAALPLGRPLNQRSALDRASHSLKIVRGIHAGATIPLPAGTSVVGSAPDCDILLADPGVAPHHLEIVLEGMVVSARRIDDAEVRVKDRPVIGQRVILHVGSVVELGDCAFRVNWEDKAEQTNDFSGRPQNSRTPLVAWLVIGALGLLLLALGWEFWQSQRGVDASGSAKTASTASPGQPFEQAIEALNAKNLKLERVRPDAYRLSGFVDNQDQARAVALITRQAAGLRVESHFLVGTQVADWIRDSIASPQLSVKYIGDGKVSIEGEVQGDAFRTRLVQVHQQFARLVQIQDKTRPSEKRPEPPPPAARPKPAETLEVVPGAIGSDGKPIFTVSDGRQRYFEGATLPDGRIIQSVRANGIVMRMPDGALQEVRP